MLYKKNSILDRPVKPPSVRNYEAGPDEFANKQRRDALVAERINTHKDLDGYASRNGWTDPGHLSTTMYDNTHRLHTIITEKGVEKVYNADIDTPSGVMKVPAPWDRAENYNPEAALLDIVAPMSPGAAPNSSPGGSFSPASGTPKRLLHGKQYSVPENDPTDDSTQLRRVQPPSALDGSYNPILHHWNVEPSDPSRLDREAMPTGLRSKHNMYRP